MDIPQTEAVRDDSLLGRPLTPAEAARLADTPLHALPLSRTLLLSFTEAGYRTAADLYKVCGSNSFGPIRGRRIRRVFQDLLVGEFSLAIFGETPLAELRSRIEALLGILDARRQTLIRRKYGLWDGRRHDHYQLASVISADYRSAQAELAGAHSDLRTLLRPRTDEFQSAVRTLYRALLAAKQGMAGVHEWEDPGSALYAGQVEPSLAFAFLCRVGSVVPERLVAMGLHGVCYDGPLTARRHDEVVDAMKTALVNHDRPVSFEQMRGWLRRIEPSEAFLRRCVAVSHEFGFMRSGMIGLRSAAYFDAHSLRDMARAALVALKEPAHFEEIARTIERLYPERAPVNAHSVYHTLVVHKTSFALAKHGGIYGLSEWPERAVGSLKGFLQDFIRRNGGRASRQELLSAAQEHGYKAASVSTILYSHRSLFKRTGWGRWALVPTVGLDP